MGRGADSEVAQQRKPDFLCFASLSAGDSSVLLQRLCECVILIVIKPSAKRVMQRLKRLQASPHP